MRRHTKQDRDDRYTSRRDYQQTLESLSDRIYSSDPISTIQQTFTCDPATEVQALGFGGYIATPESSELLISIHTTSSVKHKRFQSSPSWSRVGLAFEASPGERILVNIEFKQPQKFVDIWGLTSGACHFPEGIQQHDIVELNQSHLMPETLYLQHENSQHNDYGYLKFAAQAGQSIILKKCSYCARQLPIGPGPAGRLSFHKHNAKVTQHQNECRACKKWRINDSFNPLRTTDQLNESSIITRERKLLLREPEILRSIKERSGRGLKSIIWEKFGKRCFYCDKLLELKEVELDHTRPLAYLWPIDEHATCLCSEHNNHKKDKFPVEFYNPSQLQRLSDITGLPMAELTERQVCLPQLDRIRRNIATFANSCDPRAFNAIARKVKEILPEVELWQELRAANLGIYQRVKNDADRRPSGDEAAKAAAALNELDALED
ncbi:hypothetical protein FV226_26180 [Methylobacterium sp. WL12]|uniref:HNH endonuclease n=1 Tax=Methylobacterium sp. WL12 TaxID=2603890 RepID=UPI0011C74093|nr:hypothetical protein [Methylobacterium sp. WL12]TXM64691.1 hypothetical protein FV226_26180 [Methylobacterium sp. WL12]